MKKCAPTTRRTVFAPGTDFYYLTGDIEPDCVLVMIPQGAGHRDILFTEPNPGKSDATFFTDRVKGELWVGPRLGVEQSQERYGIAEAWPLFELDAFIEDHVAMAPFRTLRGIDPEFDDDLDPQEERDLEFAAALSELRLIKDDLEIAELRSAIASTHRGFDDVIRALPGAVTERVVEGVFQFARTR